MNDLLSVIVPIFNVEEILLRNSINSILNQSYQNIEVLLIDDGSSNNCGAICDEYSTFDNRVVVFHTKNKGVSSARNLGLTYSKGKYITFVDSDDTLQERMLEELYMTLKRSNADCAMCGCEYIRNVYNNSFNSLNKNVYHVKFLTQTQTLNTLFYMKRPYKNLEITAVWGKLYKKELLTNIRFDSAISIGEDFLFNFHYIRQVKSVICLDMKGYNYLIHSASSMRNGFKRKKLNTIPALITLIKNVDNTLYKKGVIARSVNIAIIILFMIPIDDKYSKERNMIINFIKNYRLEVLKNPKARNKVKIALLISYIGFDTMQMIFEKISSN